MPNDAAVDYLEISRTEVLRANPLSGTRPTDNLLANFQNALGLVEPPTNILLLADRTYNAAAHLLIARHEGDEQKATRFAAEFAQLMDECVAAISAARPNQAARNLGLA